MYFIYKQLNLQKRYPPQSDKKYQNMDIEIACADSDLLIHKEIKAKPTKNEYQPKIGDKSASLVKPTSEKLNDAAIFTANAKCKSKTLTS